MRYRPLEPCLLVFENPSVVAKGALQKETIPNLANKRKDMRVSLVQRFIRGPTTRSGFIANKTIQL